MSQISIIIPVYKVEKYLERCVESIIAQTFRDFELILVDDGSPDRCPEICDDYAQRDGRIRVIHQKNGGLSAARNAGIDWVFANSNSEWITFADSDDWVHPKYLESLYNAALHSESDVVIARFALSDGESIKVDESLLEEKMWNVEEFFCEHRDNATSAWGKLYRRHCFESIRYPVGKIHEDDFVTYQILFKYNTIPVVEQPLYAYFKNNDGITRSEWNPRRLDGMEAWKEQIVFFSAWPKARYYVVCKLLTQYADIIEYLERSGQYPELIPQLYSELRNGLVRYRKIVQLKEVPYAAEKAFPGFMKLYWIGCALKNKIRRIFD